jgi:hypothetical protein
MTLFGANARIGRGYTVLAPAPNQPGSSSFTSTDQGLDRSKVLVRQWQLGPGRPNL